MKVAYGASAAQVEGVARVFSALALSAVILMGLLGSHGIAAEQRLVRLAAFGDSLTAGHELTRAQAFPAVLEKALRERGHTVEVLNAGVSGDTTSAALARLDWSIPEGTEGVIVELGANDALRGIDPAVPRKALTEILQRFKDRKIPVLFTGMLAPPNYGPEYAAKFNAIYPDLAKQFDVPLYPFFLDGVAGDAKLNFADGIHPTAAGVEVIVARILPEVEALIGRIRAAQP